MPNVNPSLRQPARIIARTAAGPDPRTWPAALRLMPAALAAGLLTVLALAGPSGATAETPARTTKSAAATPAPIPSSLPKIPKPGTGSKEEAAFIALLDKAIAPAATYQISAEEAALVRDAIKAIAATNLSKGMELKAKVQDPAAQKLIDWYRLRSGYGEPAEFKAFLAGNPAWPDRTLLQQRLEEAIFTQGGTAASIRAHFKDKEPQTGVGRAALASAYLAEGRAADAAALAGRAWREHTIPATLETGFLERFGKILPAADHKARLDRLIVDDIRWNGERTARAAFAKRLIPLLPADYQKTANARLAVFSQSKGAKALLDAVPAPKEPDWGLTFHRIQILRRTGHASDAARLLLAAPTDPAKIVVPDSWWDERRAAAYTALKLGKPKLAYDLVQEAGPLTVNPLKEQRFMAGWIALRHLKDTKEAERQFLALKATADGPLSRAKANYWLGRTADARTDPAAAAELYKAATVDGDTFHGLLSMQKLKRGQQAIEIKAPAEPSSELIARFNGQDSVKAVVIARKASLDASIMRSFIVHLRSVYNDEAGSALVAHLSEAVGDTQMAVRTGKSAVAARQNMLYYAYPVHPFPAYTPLRKPPEMAFLLGIARQETEFNTLTVSGAGAKGLLQVMTVTAKHVCADYKMKCDIGRLLADPSYNATLASAYIGDRMEEFSGSYILTLAGYNAGPGRARQWIAEFGDPRDPKIDPLDWIERIPIQETREYVAKVLANVQVYRARLGDTATALQLEDDLNRARGTRPVAVPSDPSSQKEAQN